MSHTHKNPKRRLYAHALRPVRDFLCGLCVAAAIVGCVKDDGDEAAPDLGYGYFPLQAGTYVEYRVDSVFHDHPDPSIEGIHDTSRYFVKEVYDAFITDGMGEEAMRIVRYKRWGDTLPWQTVDVWVAKITARNAQRVEENQRYVKLGFPVADHTQWDANALNTGVEWRCSYDSLHLPRAVDDLEFDRTVRVNLRDFKNLVEDQFAYEIYADGVGMIEKYHRDLTTQVDYSNNPVAANIRSGFEYRMKIVDYGVE